ncbi:MAG: hypothetical protein K9G67_05150 [Bacteroidales bacterium]|nr:hypothetical protein [Bacteroidales bacterium]MCF8345049.1 hypothetical protein [Bacteroidales bacterium]MCF8352645.1 hypothetical protein [Bacteroidales bacterium]MCF8375720.1 hypothetical protein [Bacteroidales bacterium]MCF8400320.1 hypothetical protein [Bacteroidales bacterium]
MRQINTAYLSEDECWGIQINGHNHCQNCKWIGISACEGKRIVRTGRNSKGYRIGDHGIIMNDYDPKYDVWNTKEKIGNE